MLEKLIIVIINVIGIIISFKYLPQFTPPIPILITAIAAIMNSDTNMFPDATHAISESRAKIILNSLFQCFIFELYAIVSIEYTFFSLCFIFLQKNIPYSETPEPA